MAATMLLLTVTGPLSAQTLPKDVTKSVDTFTGDTIYKTKYGRLDSPQGCGRTDIAIDWLLISGPRGKSERVAYQWGMIDAPFSPKATWLNGVAAVLNIDGEMIETESHLLGRKLKGGGREFHETGWFTLPRGTLRQIVEAKDAKLRIAGTELTCDGTIEQNMIVRIRALLEYADRQ
jgi:hypothetical protein